MSLRIALLGVAHYHANFWLRAFMQCDDVVITGVWDDEPARLDAFATRHGVGATSDLAALLKDCDAVAICSTTRDHARLIGAAAAEGRAVLCEKPLATSMADCESIASTVAQSGIGFMQSFPKRFDPINHEIRSLLRRGEIGRVSLCRVRHGHSHGFDPEFRKGWYVDPELSGGGTLLDEGVHGADFLRWMFGEPLSAFATVSSDGFALPVEDSAAAIFRFEGGLIAELATSWGFAAADTSIEIYGSKGTILLGGVDIASRPTRDRDFLRIFRSETGSWTSSPTVPNFKTGVFHEHVAWGFVEALREGGPMPVTLEDGHRAFAMIDAAYRSARSGRSEAIGL